MNENPLKLSPENYKFLVERSVYILKQNTDMKWKVSSELQDRITRLAGFASTQPDADELLDLIIYNALVFASYQETERDAALTESFK